MRNPGARVAVVGTSDAEWAAIRGWLTHELTSVNRFDTPADLLRAGRPDVIVVDRSSLHDGGLALRRIRQTWLTCVIIVAGASDERDAEQLLDVGADDAVRLGDRLLAPRLRAATRRARTVNAGMRIAIGDIVFDREARRVWCAGCEVRLTRTEEALLDCLFWYAPRAASVAELTSFAWGHTSDEQRNRVHVYIRYLRNKLRDSRHVVIHTIRGVGYEFAERREHEAD